MSQLSVDHCEPTRALSPADVPAVREDDAHRVVPRPGQRPTARFSTLATIVVGWLICTGCASLPGGGKSTQTPTESPAERAERAATARGDRIVRKSLVRTSHRHLERARDLKEEAKVKADEQILEKAKTRYARAAAGFGRLLERFPDAGRADGWRFLRADALYYSGRFMEAYRVFRDVRDGDDVDRQRRVEAAYMAVKAVEFHLKSLADQGQLRADLFEKDTISAAREKQLPDIKRPEQPSSDGETNSGTSTVEKEPMPDPVQTYVGALDAFVELDPQEGDHTFAVLEFAFRAAKMYYDYNHYETARKRFERIFDEYPDREEAYLAASLLVESLRRQKKYDELAKWADELDRKLASQPNDDRCLHPHFCVDPIDRTFKKAERLFDEGKYEKSAQTYLELVADNPNHPNVPRALNNAAVAHEHVDNYRAATTLYERVYRDYPDSDLRPYALYRIAINAERSFEFARAADLYLTFYERFDSRTPRELEQMGFDMTEKRPKALLSAAVLRQNLRDHETAAELYERFAHAYPSHDETTLVHWQIIEAWEAAGVTKKLPDAFEAYRRRDDAEADRILEGLMKLARWHDDGGRRQKALDRYRTIAERCEQRDLEPGSTLAEFAAKARFELAEQQYRDWTSLDGPESAKDPEHVLESTPAEQKRKVVEAYRTIPAYEVPAYAVAARYRIGRLHERWADKLSEVTFSGTPDSEEHRRFRTELDELTGTLRDRALAEYRRALRTARDAGVVDRWTRKTIEALQAYQPIDHLRIGQVRTAKQERLVTGGPLRDFN